ncbi:hypothetical protein [Paenibacillus sp. IITD108]|uniref:hypothetical protein n=1 Tax=Paenibacillus sp. IITD108 TaxID=3116649 RepID=UPI002F40DF25
MDFINEIANLKTSEIGILLTETKALIETNTALISFNKEHPNLGYGIIKDISEVQNINCYVNYRIKKSGTKIGDFTIGNDSYSDEYFISSYSYSQIFGYLPSDDWTAVLQLSEASSLSESGIYETSVVEIGTTRLIDSKGFEKDYPRYREVTQEDLDKYYQVNELVSQQNELNHLINMSINRITERLS